MQPLNHNLKTPEGREQVQHLPELLVGFLSFFSVVPFLSAARRAPCFKFGPQQISFIVVFVFMNNRYAATVTSSVLSFFISSFRVSSLSFFVSRTFYGFHTT
jgi:hypothetical protein